MVLNNNYGIPSYFSKIDWMMPNSPYCLSRNDECYHLTEWVVSEEKVYGDRNRLIDDFKWGSSQEKFRASQAIANAFGYAVRRLSSEMDVMLFGQESSVVYVPMPPSKASSDPGHDNRLVDMLRQVDCPHETWELDDSRLNVQEMVERLTSTIPAHQRRRLGGRRQTVDEIEQEHRVVPPIGYSPSIIAVVDDVITAGAHYVAARRLLTREFSSARIMGLFVARTVWK